MKHLLAQFKGASMGTIIVGSAGIVTAIGVVVATIVAIVVNNTPQETATTRQEEITEVEDVVFIITEQEDNTKAEGVTEVKQEGKNGEKTIKYVVMYDSDGNEISREKVSEEITTEPVDKIVAKGTKKTPVATTQQLPTSTNNSQQTQPDKCKTMLSGWGRPSTCPPQTRAEFTALGGWEKLVETFYTSHKDMEPLKRCDGTTCVYERSGTSSFLCSGSISVDMDTLTVLSVKWDDQPTSTCDAVRNEHPPLPSTDYLTQYLRSLVK